MTLINLLMLSGVYVVAMWVAAIVTVLLVSASHLLTTAVRWIARRLP